MEASDTASQGQTQSHTQGSAKTEVQLARLQVVETSVCALALAVSISLWFIAIRAPLWLDETHSFFVIKAGFAKIYSRMGWPIVPVYPYILWFGSKVLGTSEIALRIPSIVAMLGAVYLLYRAARELFDRDAALIAAVVFCLHPIVISAAIDVRPYAFAAFTINASILALVRLRNDRSDWLAALFGVLAAGIGHFQFIFTIILPALAVCFIYAKIDDRRALWRQGSIALAAFTLFFLPVIPVLEVMFKTSGTHVFDDAPDLSELGWTLAPAWLLYIFLATILLAIATRQLDLRRRLDRWSLLLCASLALVPILILFGVSVETSIHVFVARYRLVAIPGIALCWAWLINRVNSPAIRSLFCVAMVASIAYPLLTSPEAKEHGYTWKYALEVAEKDASTDGSPVLICSDFPESDELPIPVGAAVKDSGLFAPLSYYPLSVPVVGLPRALNGNAMRIISSFVQDAAQQHKRFVALAFTPSFKTLDFIRDAASSTHDIKLLGTIDGIGILEFTPRSVNGSRTATSN